MNSRGWKLGAAGLTSFFLGGCATVPPGSPPHVDRLAQLQPGQSTSGDVLLLLGEPRGRGAARLAADMEPDQIWFYEYEVRDGKKVEAKILLVYMREDLYDGYLWFSSSLAL